MNTDHPRNPDRLIWLSLLSVMAVALIADQARANLHPASRAAGMTAAVAAPVWARMSAADAWCRSYGAALTMDAPMDMAGAPRPDSAHRPMRDQAPPGATGPVSRQPDNITARVPAPRPGSPPASHEQ